MPIVTILLEGGKEAIRIVKERLMVGISCIVIEGNHLMHPIIIFVQCKKYKWFTYKSLMFSNWYCNLGSGRAADIIGYAYKNAIKYNIDRYVSKLSTIFLVAQEFYFYLIIVRLDSNAFLFVVHHSETTVYKLKEGHVKEIKKMIYNAYGTHIKNRKQNAYHKEDFKRILGWVLECIQYSNIITLFDIRRYVFLWLNQKN